MNAILKAGSINLVLLCLLWLSSCSPSRKLGEHEYLLRANKIKISKHQVSAADLQGFLRQKPNKRVLGVFPLEIWAWQYANKGNQGGFKRWIGRSIGEKPVLLDTSLSLISARNMKTYLGNVGYYNAEVTIKYRFHRKKARVSYLINPAEPYTIRNIRLVVQDSVLARLMQEEEENTLLHKGDNYNVYVMDKERDRITRWLRNNGYYAFSKDYISYLADSTIGNKQIDLRLKLMNPSPDETDSAGKGGTHHRLSRFRDIIIDPDYNPLEQEGLGTDTLAFLAGQKLDDRQPRQKYLFIHKGKMRVRPSVITQNLFLNQGELFRLTDVEQTYTRLNDLQFFRFVNIELFPVPDSGTGEAKLDARIQLTRNKIMALSFETEGTNAGGDLGIAANLVFENRNVFKGAELLNVKLKGALEMQKRIGESDVADKRLFNTFETGLQTSIVFPRFLIPVRAERFPRYFRPKTRVNAGFNFQERSTFRRYLTELSFGYEWKESPYRRHLLNPFEINSVRIFPDSTFTAELLALDDQRLTDQYTDHLIMALKYSYIYNNQQINKKEDFFYFRANFESAGNMLSLANRLLKSKKSELGQYSVIGIKYSQYLKLDGDFRYYNLLGTTSVVYRAALGLGYPYNNSTSLPFDKGFYAGGANGMRGWAIRSLGPGAYQDAEGSFMYEKMGDILFESNLEWRFPLVGLLHGAVFGDMGNIWLLNPSDKIPGGEFKWDVFYRQIALDAGLGFRLDFTFFIFRLDGAVQLKNPALADDSWVKLGRMNPSDIMWNFGIGYPF